MKQLIFAATTLTLLLILSLNSLAQTTADEIQSIEAQITQITDQIKTANKNKQREQAQALRDQRTALQTQVRELKKRLRDEKRNTEQQAKRAAAEREWQTYPADKQLCTAIEYNRFDLVKKVIESGSIDLQKNNDHCFFPLGEAANRGFFEISEYLLQKHSPLSMRAPQFHSLISAMDLAATSKEDRIAILNLLKKHGAKPADSKETSVPGEVVATGNEESDTLLKEKYNLSGDQLNQGSTLPRALEKGHINNIRWLLANGANAEEIILGRSALMIAIDSNELEKVKLLVEAGADVNKRGLNFRSALHYAEQRRDRSGAKKKQKLDAIIAYLISKGATKSAQEQ